MTLPMSWDEWAAHDATALAARVHAGEITPAELAAQAAAAIARTDPALNAVIELFDDVVADPMRDGMNPAGPFGGAPYLMKDLGPTLKGRLQEMGSFLMRGNRATADSFLTQKIRAAGLTIIGRTTTPEFGCCSAADNPAMYSTRNPWDVAYTTNGSSAGSGAMVAAGAVPVAHATDGGGSIRIPAGACGNIGLKVSRGVFSIAPAASDLTGLVSIQGCHSRTVRDTAAFVDACRGGAPGEFMPYWTAPTPYTELIERDPPRLKIALSHEWGDYRAVPPFVQALERAGRSAELIGTGQTAWMQGARYGLVLDALVNDFVAGEIEHAVWSAWSERRPDVVVIEGQGSLMHPAYPGGFEILAAARPDGIVVQHAPARREYDGFPGCALHPLDVQIRALELVSGRPVVAVTLNHEGLAPDQLAAAIRDIASATGLPVCAPLAGGVDVLIEPILHRFSSR
ncbi:MAG: DUF1611 domain-containing protein [Alphaproteobacteria bacterium]|nr:DUF1611 domain-containing protein [Alphaproteobacteria bacterium]